MSSIHRILMLLLVSFVWGYVCWRLSHRYNFKKKVAMIFVIFAIIWCFGSIVLIEYDSIYLNVYLGVLDGIFLGSGGLFLGNTCASHKSH